MYLIMYEGKFGWERKGRMKEVYAVPPPGDTKAEKGFFRERVGRDLQSMGKMLDPKISFRFFSNRF